uniref:Uncharacterized protein n=1 Tax=Oryza rufipogon TaxID=4529 RepID=A0A0E0PTC7_ORYRU
MEIVRSRDRILELDGVGGAGAGAREGRRPAAKRLPPRPHDLCAARSGPASTAASRDCMSGVQNTAEDGLPDGGASELSTKTSVTLYSDETRRSLHAILTAFNMSVTSAMDGLSFPLALRHILPTLATSWSRGSASMLAPAKLVSKMFSTLLLYRPQERSCEALEVAIAIVAIAFFPVISSSSTTPKLYTSLFSVSFLSCRYSGSRYPRVPCTIAICSTASLDSHRDAPKSVTFTV